MNYAEDYLKLKEHLRDIGEAMLHKREEEVPTLIIAMRMRLKRLEEFVNGRIKAASTATEAKESN